MAATMHVFSIVAYNTNAWRVVHGLSITSCVFLMLLIDVFKTFSDMLN